MLQLNSSVVILPLESSLLFHSVSLLTQAIFSKELIMNTCGMKPTAFPPELEVGALSFLLSNRLLLGDVSLAFCYTSYLWFATSFLSQFSRPRYCVSRIPHRLLLLIMPPFYSFLLDNLLRWIDLNSAYLLNMYYLSLASTPPLHSRQLSSSPAHYHPLVS